MNTTIITSDTSPPPAANGVPAHFRLVRPQEIVVTGDFVMNQSLELEPWEGPGGFRADSFVKPIYRSEN